MECNILLINIIGFLITFYVSVVYGTKAYKFIYFYSKVSCIQLGILISSFLSILPALLSPKDPRNMLISSWIFKNTVLKFVKLKVNVIGVENMDNTKPSIIVANHQSFLDMAVLTYIASFIAPCAFVVKRAFLYMGPIGLYFWLTGTLFIDRSKSKEAKQYLTDQLEVLKKNNTKLWIFPEGTRNSKDDLLPFKKGAFYLAIQAQIPIIPTVISSYSTFYNKKTIMFNDGQVDVHFLPPISTKGLTTDDIPELVQKVRNSMMQVLKHYKEL